MLEAKNTFVRLPLTELGDAALSKVVRIAARYGIDSVSLPSARLPVKLDCNVVGEFRAEMRKAAILCLNTSEFESAHSLAQSLARLLKRPVNLDFNYISFKVEKRASASDATFKQKLEELKWLSYEGENPCVLQERSVTTIGKLAAGFVALTLAKFEKRRVFLFDHPDRTIISPTTSPEDLCALFGRCEGN